YDYSYNKHRINIPRLTDPFIVDMFATSPHLLSTFICLETLVLDNISIKSFDEILNDLNVLPNLNSLIINLAEHDKNLAVFFSKTEVAVAVRQKKINIHTLPPNINEQLEFHQIKNLKLLTGGGTIDDNQDLLRDG
ncbi:unnamed protein product, partial [Rotaria sp. Silwood2]